MSEMPPSMLPGDSKYSEEVSQNLIDTATMSGELYPDDLPGGGIPRASSELPPTDQYEWDLPADYSHEDAVAAATAILNTAGIRDIPKPDDLPEHRQATSEPPAHLTAEEYERGLPE